MGWARVWFGGQRVRWRGGGGPEVAAVPPTIPPTPNPPFHLNVPTLDIFHPFSQKGSVTSFPTPSSTRPCPRFGPALPARRGVLRCSVVRPRVHLVVVGAPNGFIGPPLGQRRVTELAVCTRSCRYVWGGRGYDLAVGGVVVGGGVAVGMGRWCLDCDLILHPSDLHFSRHSSVSAF
jgi:hypothetical protein